MGLGFEIVRIGSSLRPVNIGGGVSTPDSGFALGVCACGGEV